MNNNNTCSISVDFSLDKVAKELFSHLPKEKQEALATFVVCAAICAPGVKWLVKEVRNHRTEMAIIKYGYHSNQVIDTSRIPAFAEPVAL